MKKRLLMVFSNVLLIAICLMAQPPKPPSPEERLKHVSEKISKEITLSAVQKTKVETAYKEFFAEMTEAFFGANDFFPFNRAELQHEEPALFALLTKVWMSSAKP